MQAGPDQGALNAALWAHVDRVAEHSGARMPAACPSVDLGALRDGRACLDLAGAPVGPGDGARHSVELRYAARADG